MRGVWLVALAITVVAIAVFCQASIFTAIQKQLGLKLEPTKGRVDVMVVGSVQTPSEN